VKSKIRSLSFLLIILITISCKKEKDPAIFGSWASISNYREENGAFSWTPTNGYSQFITFYPDARFNTFFCIPTGGGTYVYDHRVAKISLKFEADHYGTIPGTATYKIEELTNSRLVVSSFSPAGNLQFKTEYVRNE